MSVRAASRAAAPPAKAAARRSRSAFRRAAAGHPRAVRAGPARGRPRRGPERTGMSWTDSHHRVSLARVDLTSRGSPRPRRAGREAAHHAGPVPAEPQRAAPGLQPVHEPRPGRRVRRADDPRGARAPGAPPLGPARERGGSRATKYRHLLDEALELDVPEISVLAVLMLRGPQTPGELRARTERLHGFGGPGRAEADARIALPGAGSWPASGAALARRRSASPIC